MGRRLIAGSVLLVAVSGSGIFYALSAGGDSGAKSPGTLPTATAPVQRGDLVDHKTVDGTLGYAGERSVPNSLTGTLTWVPAEGSTIKQGRPLYKADRLPVTLMYGTTPVYRTLEYGISDGPDVEQLERALDALGYGSGFTVDDHFSPATADAVTAWQADHGLTETGSVDAHQVVFLPEAVRVKHVAGGVGDKAGKSVVTVTSVRRVVTVKLAVADQQLARKGATVTVELPGGKTAKGKISKAGTVATAPPASSSGGAQDPTIDVEVTLDDSKTVGSLDEAPVSVDLQSDSRKNVLSVPVEALLALREGGYGVQVVEGTGTRYLPVQLGLFASGRVEVSGQGLSEGMKIGVPGS